MKINIHAGHNPANKIACGAVGLLNELAYSREVNSKLLASNEVLAKEISTKLDYLLERIDK